VAVVLVVATVAAFVLMHADGDGSPSEAMAVDEQAKADVSGYSLCRGGPTVSTSVDRFMKLAGAQGEAVITTSGRAGNAQVTFEYPSVRKTAIFAYSESTRTVTALNVDAASVLRVMENACTARGGR
jgi:hypothetical protein